MNNTPHNLKSLYTSRMAGLNALNSVLLDSEDYDGPFLMSEPSDEYNSQKERLLVVGQETNGWIGDRRVLDTDGIDRNIEQFSTFEFGKHWNSLFFQYTRYLAKEITGSASYMWTNLNKFGKGSGKGRPSLRVTNAETEHFNILQEEIKILNPTCVVFLTGPNYDDLIKNRLNHAEFIKIEGFTIRQLAKIATKTLEIPIFRIYHPGYGNRIKSLYLKTIEYIKANKSAHTTPAIAPRYPRMASALARKQK